ncbi:cytochrome P450 [Camillea tinctor]|nr:cytochrome P450 [Camillea tinctor]
MYCVMQMFQLSIGIYVIYYAFSVIYLAFFHRLASFPGRKLWSVSRIPWAYHVLRGDLWQVLDELHEVYGPVVRIAPNEVTTTFPCAWKEIYASKPLLLKDPYSQTPALNGSHSLFTAEGDTHKRIRAVLNHSFSDKALRSQALIIERYADRFMDRIRREVAEKKNQGTIDLTKLYGYTSFDTITDLSLGEPLCDGLADLNEHDWVKNYFFHAKFSAIHTALSHFWPLDKVLGLVFIGITRKARERNWRIITGALDRRLAQVEKKDRCEKNQRSDLLSPLVNRLEREGNSNITRGETLSNGLAFVIAGTQLNTNVLSTATYLLLRHREKWDRLTEEIRTRFACDADITMQTTSNLPYLDAVINETLRIRHPTPINLPRVVPNDAAIVLNGQTIPKNVVVGINLHAIQNDSTFWIEPRKFNPERFLPATHPFHDSRFDDDVKDAFAPFSVGPRNCIGNRLFFAQVRLLLARVAWSFDLVRAEKHEDVGQQGWMQQRAWFAFESQPLIVDPKPRLEHDE